jgi:hypothetical protein
MTEKTKVSKVTLFSTEIIQLFKCIAKSWAIEKETMVAQSNETKQLSRQFC